MWSVLRREALCILESLCQGLRADEVVPSCLGSFGRKVAWAVGLERSCLFLHILSPEIGMHQVTCPVTQGFVLLWARGGGTPDTPRGQGPPWSLGWVSLPLM